MTAYRLKLLLIYLKQNKTDFRIIIGKGINSHLIGKQKEYTYITSYWTLLIIQKRMKVSKSFKICFSRIKARNCMHGIYCSSTVESSNCFKMQKILPTWYIYSNLRRNITTIFISCLLNNLRIQICLNLS